ncbi:hypothetical protein [Pseudomonas sp. GM55]|uniref:hypothetical protein n=1 Tax=Pseudomonas sp. GM55 TaxID=1144333 RepID=UPI00027086DC|nr:hypothetical protein [Pseudomonas sp. GM55]EJM79268.1 hypothetical protein PMI31_00075 [Pseudomonas sp. GM55]
MKKPWFYAALLMALSPLALAQHASSKDAGSWYLQTSVYTTHYSPDPRHNNNQDLIGLERINESDWLLGAATFRNSYSQRSHYVYAGKRYESAFYPVYIKFTGGLLEGYRGKHKDKIPLNRFGVAPVIIPSLGTQYGPVAAELVLLGFNAAMVTTGVHF